MGKLNQGLHGALSGSVGNVVGATWKGIPYIRTKPAAGTKKMVGGQKQQCSKFALAVQLARMILPYVRVGYRTEAQGKTEFNAAISSITKYGMRTVDEGYEVDYANVFVSRGLLTQVEDAVVRREDEGYVFEWADNSGQGDAKATDWAMPMVMNTTRRVATYLTEGATRADGRVCVKMPRAWDGDVCVCYLGMSAADGGEVANSIYLGEAQVLTDEPLVATDGSMSVASALNIQPKQSIFAGLKHTLAHYAMMIKENVSLAAYNTFGIKAMARYLATYANVDELRGVLRAFADKHLPVMQIGGGSNLLFVRDFEGLILVSGIRYIRELGDELLAGVHKSGEVLLEVGAGVVWDDFVEFCVERGYYGVENLSHIPGQVGASAVQNIGAYGVEAKDVIFEVRCVDRETLEEVTFANAELGYAYRMSRFKTDLKDRYVITSVVYQLSTDEAYSLDYSGLRSEVERRGELSLIHVRETVIAVREAKLPDPEVLGNAGSFFMNPMVDRAKYEALCEEYERVPHYVVSEREVKIPAAWLIEQCGLKGQRMGAVGVHETQPLVLVNHGGATGDEVLSLADRVVQQVDERFDIRLKMEVIVVG